MKNLSSEIEKIIERNKKVEQDKAWEISWTRKIIISVLTFFFIAWILFLTGTDEVVMWSLISTIGFIISTTALKPVRKIWEKF